MNDNVNKPSHYTSGSIECIDAMLETQGPTAVYHFCVNNAFKYLWRHNKKNGKEDVRKANWYLNKAVDILDKYEILEKEDYEKIIDKYWASQAHIDSLEYERSQNGKE